MDKLIEAVSNDTLDRNKSGSIKKKQVLVYKKYHQVFPESLHKYNGYRIKMETKTGRYYQGTLNTKNPEYFEVNTHMRSGNVGYQIPLYNIKKVEVFY